LPRSRGQAGEINKSLSQLALVIQRLTSPGSLEACSDGKKRNETGWGGKGGMEQFNDVYLCIELCCLD